MAKRLYFKDYYYLQGNHVHIHGVGGLKLPSGDTIDRPDVMESTMRYNAELNQYEMGTNDSLVVLHDRNDGTGTFYSTYGGELKGDLVIKDHRIQNNPGTSALPAYTFYNDPDTGINTTGSDSLDIVVGGSINATPALNIFRSGSGDNDQTVVVNGDLVVKGTQTNINSTDLYVEDQIITLNRNGSAAGKSGIEIEADSSIASKFLYDFSLSKWTTEGKSITDVPVPVAGTDVTNKSYVDTEIQTTEDEIRTDMDAKDQELDNKITTERNRAIARENENEQAIQDEETRATNREDQLDSDIQAEETRATNREDQLDNDKEDKANKSQPNGYASLDENAHVPKVELPTDTLYANVATASEIVFDDSAAGVNGGDVQVVVDDLGSRVKSIEDGNLNQEAVQDIAGAMVSENVENGIKVTYDDVNGKLDFDVNDFLFTVNGDLTGSVTVTDLGDTTLTATLVDESVQDIVGAMVSGNTEQGIAVTYNDVTNKLDFDVNDFDITLGGDMTGSGTVTDLGNVFINTTLNSEAVEDILGDMFTGNVEKGIVVTYNDATNKIDLDVNDFNITLTGGVSGVGTVTDLGNVTINTTIDYEGVEDRIGDMVTGNVEKGIAVTYDDVNGKLDFDVNDFDIVLTGHMSGSGTVTDLGNVSINTTLDSEVVEDLVGNMVTGNVENGIVVTYNDTLSKLDFDVNDFDVTLDGDVSGTGTVTDLGNVTITTTLSNNLTGNYDIDGELNATKFTLNNPSDNTDPLEIYRHDVAADQTDMRIRIGDNNSGDDKLSIGYENAGTWTEAAHIKNNGDGYFAGDLVVDGTITGQIQNNIDWANIDNKPDPTITLAGDATGNTTLTDVTDGTLSMTIDPQYNLIVVPDDTNYPNAASTRLGLNPITSAQSFTNPDNGFSWTGLSILEDQSKGTGTTGFQMMVNWANGTTQPVKRPAIRTKDVNEAEFGTWRELAWYDEVEKGTFEYKIETSINSGASFDITKADIFGTTDLASKGIDFRDVIIDVKVLDTDGASPTNNMWINASAVSTYGVDTVNELVKVINEYTSSLQFYIRISL